MKRFNITFKALILLFTISTFYNSVSAQIYVTASVNHYCLNQNNGSIKLIFDPSIIQNFLLPFSAEWENLSNGDSELQNAVVGCLFEF